MNVVPSISVIMSDSVHCMNTGTSIAAAHVALHRVGLLEQHDRPQHARRVIEACRGRRPLDRPSRGREEIDVRLKALARRVVGPLPLGGAERRELRRGRIARPPALERLA